MPNDISKKFEDTYHLDRETVIKNVYQKPGANSYLASFAKFLGEIRDTEYAQQILNSGLSEFIETNIKSYPQYNKYKCNFVGSISYVFADELNALCAASGVRTGKIIRQPINDLLQYILEKG
jgi:glucosamine kinase